MKPSIFTAHVRVVRYFDLPVVMAPSAALTSILCAVFDRALNAHRPFRFTRPS